MRLYEVASADNSATKLANFIGVYAKEWLRESKQGSYSAFRGLTSRSLPPANGDLENVLDPDALANGIAFTGIGMKQNRRPLDTSAIRTTAFNGMIRAIGGVADRSNSIFATGKEQTAAAYGKPFIVIPLGPFNYTWSVLHRDWTGHFGVDEIRGLLLPEVRPLVDVMDRWDLNNMQYVYPGAGSKYSDMLSILADPASYDTTKVNKLLRVDRDWAGAISARHEIMIHCPKVLYVDTSFMIQQLEDKLKEIR